MQQRPPSRAGLPASRPTRSGAPSGGSPRLPGTGRSGFRIDDRVLLASVLVVLGVSLVVFAGLIVSGAGRLGGGDDDDGQEVLAQGAGLAGDEPATPSPPPVSTATAVPTAANAAQTNADGPVVCLDVGHGGADLGNVRSNFEETEVLLMEKDVTLEQALDLRERLVERGVGVVLTRETDTAVNATNVDVNGDGEVGNDDNGDGLFEESLGEYANQLDELQARVNVCNEAEADLLVSIHVNSSGNEFLQGFEAYWADDENAEFIEESSTFAMLAVDSLNTEFTRAEYEPTSRGAAPDSSIIAPDNDPETFDHNVVLSPDKAERNYTGATMPSVIVECLFLSNDEDYAFLTQDPDLAQNAIVTAYENAILEFFADELDAANTQGAATDDEPALTPTPDAAVEEEAEDEPATEEASADAEVDQSDLDAVAAANDLPAPLADTGNGRAQTHYYGDSGRQEIALTFDLGSDRGFTEEILDFLQEREIRASFGLTGMWAEENEDLVQRMVDEGHQLFNHTYSHSSFTGFSTGAEPLTREERIAEIERTHEIIMEQTGYDMRPYFRLPYGDGSDDPEVAADIYAADYYLTIMWMCDSYGWKQWTAAEIIQHCYSETGTGGIVLMHVGSDGTDQLALPGLVDQFAADGYDFVTVAEVLAPDED